MKAATAKNKLGAIKCRKPWLRQACSAMILEIDFNYDECELVHEAIIKSINKMKKRVRT